MMDKTKKTTGCFLKFGSEIHMKALLERGEVYCGTMHWFANHKDQKLIGDKYENVFEIRNFNGSVDFKVKQEDPYKLLHNGPIQYTNAHFAHQACGNIFCLYFHDINHQQVNIPAAAAVDLISEWMVVIIDAKEFVSRVELALKSRGLDFENRFVEYEDFTKFNGRKGPFLKDLKYSRQKEYRFWIDYPVNDFLKFEIGSIKDIARLMPAKDLKSMGFKKIPANERNHFEERY